MLLSDLLSAPTGCLQQTGGAVEPCAQALLCPRFGFLWVEIERVHGESTVKLVDHSSSSNLIHKLLNTYYNKVYTTQQNKEEHFYLHL